MDKIELGELQVRWLFSRGGRTLKDVFKSDGKLMIFMYSGITKRDKMYEIPSSEGVKHQKLSKSFLYNT